MPATTPLYALPYPLPTDAVRDTDELLRALADRLDGVLAQTGLPPLTPADWQPLVDQITAFQQPPALVDEPYAAESPYSLTVATLWQWQKFRLAAITFQRAAFAPVPTAGPDGNMSGDSLQTVATVKPGHEPLAEVKLDALGRAGVGGLTVKPDGRVQLTSYAPSRTIPTGTLLGFGGTWMSN